MKNILPKLLCLLLAAVMAACLFGCASQEVRQSYDLGRSALSDGRYAEAAGYFGPLDGYKSSEKYLTNIYEEAMELYEAGSYGEAAAIFDALAQYEIEDSLFRAQVSGAYACLDDLDAAGAYARLEGADPDREEVSTVRALLEQLCFTDTVLIRPEYVAKELLTGKLAPEVSHVGKDPYLDEIVYTMTSRYTDSVYKQYREYCMRVFSDSFSDQSNNYFSFRIDDRTYYVCNFHSLYGGLAIKIPRY